jgi:hypothetical protein
MGLNSFWQNKTVNLTVNANKTVTLPDDYLQWIRIGNFNDVGELQVLAVNNNLTTFKDNNPNRVGDIASQIGNIQTSLVGDDFWGLFTIGDNANGNYNQQPFGLGSRLLTAGECSVDIANRIILLNTSFPYPNVVLQYISSPEQDFDYQLPMQFQEAMMAWLSWQDIQYLPNVNKGSASGKQNAANNFKNQLLLARKTFNPIRIQDIYLQSKDSQLYGIK